MADDGKRDEAMHTRVTERHNKIRYNADRWWAYCADRMGWQVGHWINGNAADAVRVGQLGSEPCGRFGGELTDAAAPTPSIWRTRHQRGAETVDE